MSAADQSILDKVANKLGKAPSYADDDIKSSILSAAATSYGNKPVGDESTIPTGFDPHAAALFEAVVEASFLVAKADGEFDETEQTAFKHVVMSACGDSVAERQVEALLADLSDLLDEDGMEKRIAMVARTVTKPEHAREVLLIAGLLAHVSDGVSAEERSVLEKLAKNFGLESSVVEEALAEVTQALAD